MPKKDVAPDNEITDKSKMELEALNPRQKKTKPIVDKLEKPKDKKEKDKKEKDKKIITQKELNTVNKLIDKIKQII